MYISSLSLAFCSFIWTGGCFIKYADAAIIDMHVIQVEAITDIIGSRFTSQDACYAVVYGDIMGLHLAEMPAALMRLRM